MPNWRPSENTASTQVKQKRPSEKYFSDGLNPHRFEKTPNPVQYGRI
ncbi:hypothetical protein HMPREF9123_0785 [Neisseria bacilliformis ATCC BAA-1200]|uniref:Uncharacterized protein n=1 Tax=Neisseria bacilliformis ATCC BAA-1200 TaxID=888742 RepID=F2BAF3_9NEIS|nr:hypothetical protein HMPREF9123_0785 [Neisseria bacilliformis ATCC BAA-1200]